MPTIKPLKALRPTKETAEQIAALPYDVFNREEAKQEIVGKPLSFLRVDRPETTLEDSVDLYSSEVYEKGKENLEFLKTNGYLVTEESPCLYLYELTMGNHIQTGIVANCLVDEVVNGTIKQHEQTLKVKENDRVQHINTLEAHTGPIYLTYLNKQKITDLVNKLKNKEKLYSFKSDDNVKHNVWRISDPQVIKELVSLFKEVENFYIADGHHRCSAAVTVAKNRRNLAGTNTEADNFLTVIFPDNELQVLDYNRVVKDLNGLNKDDFLEELSKKFEIIKSDNPVKPSKKYEFGLYLDKQWYNLKFKGDVPTDIVDNLEVSILYNNILNPVLGIGNLRTDKRIDFVSGLKGLNELEKKVDSGEMEVAFSVYPTSLNELMEIANQGKLMPPKSTLFEPKLRSGLFIHEFN